MFALAWSRNPEDLARVDEVTGQVVPVFQLANGNIVVLANPVEAVTWLNYISASGSLAWVCRVISLAFLLVVVNWNSICVVSWNWAIVKPG